MQIVFFSSGPTANSGGIWKGAFTGIGVYPRARRSGVTSARPANDTARTIESSTRV